MKSVLHPTQWDFTIAGDFTCEADFTRPQGRISLKKASESVLFSYVFRQLSEAKQKSTRYAGVRQKVLHKKPHFR